MPVPPWMQPPEPPPVQQGVDTYPRVIDQVATGPHHQLVTFALPGLRRATVRVPEHIWVQTDHLPIHHALVSRLATLFGGPESAFPRPDDPAYDPADYADDDSTA